MEVQTSLQDSDANLGRGDAYMSRSGIASPIFTFWDISIPFSVVVPSSFYIPAEG